MNDLHRELAPISEEAWEQIDGEAKRTLKLTLAARRLVDFVGPLGWATSAVGLGRTETAAGLPRKDVQARLRWTQPLVEFRTPFQLARDELESIARGAKDADLQPVIEAARSAALAEDHAVFHGFAAGKISGIFEASADNALTLTEDYEKYPRVVAEARDKLQSLGVNGPYGIALGERCYTGLTQATSGGYPVIKHVQRELTGPIVWAPAIDGAVLLSLRGDDFELIVGQDFSIGYLDHSGTEVQLYLQESFSFLVYSPEAAVPLVYASEKQG